MLLGQRLRQGDAESPKSDAGIVDDSITWTSAANDSGAGPGGLVLRARDDRHRIKAGTDVSVTVRMDPAVKGAIATMADDAWTMIEYGNTIRDETTGDWLEGGGRRDPVHRILLTGERSAHSGSSGRATVPPGQQRSAESELRDSR